MSARWSTLSAVLLAVLLVGMQPGRAQTVGVTGTVQGANGLPAANVLLNFTPTQTFFVPGTNTAQQVGNIGGTASPSGACAIEYQFYVNTTTHQLFECLLGVWGAVGGGSGSVTSVAGYNANGFTVSVSSPATSPVVTIGTDSTHFLPTNTGLATTYLNGAGGYSSPPGGNAVTIQSYAVDPTAPVNAAALIWNSGTSSYNVRPLTEDDIQPGFSITGFSGGSTVEIGATVTNPAFSASYSKTPTSASITNTAGIDSPLVLSSPYTSGTAVGAFTETSSISVCFTLTAILVVPKTSSQCIQWQPRSFGGIGAASATSAVTASGLNAKLSTGDILANAGISSGGYNSVYGPYTASAQKVYLLLVGGSHTFKDSVTGFAFAFNAPTAVSFVNSYGATVTMYLYESTYLLTGAYSVLVTS